MNKTVLWDDGWCFKKTSLGVTLDEALDEKFNAVDIPHDWLIYDTNNLYESSIGWYKKKFSVSKEELCKKLIVRFGAVYMDSTVYVNGRAVCEWKYGYSTFDADITEYVHEGDNEIVVKAVYQCPNTRWYSGAGIIRDVYFMTLEPLHVVPDGTYVRVRKNDDGTWHVKCSVEIENSGNDISAGDVQAGLTLSHAGSSVFTFGRMAGSEAAVFESGAKGSVELEITIDKPLIWDIDEPNLYECSVSLKYKGEVQHEESQKIGFCTKEYSPENGFILNGRKVRLNGVCEHHDNGCLGAAFNVNAFRRKLNKLRKMGVNAVHELYC